MTAASGYLRSDLRNLLELQKLDTEMDRLRAGIQRAKNDPELQALRAEADESRAAHEAVKERVHRLKRTASGEEKESDEIRAKVREMERKMYGGEVASVKELEQMQVRVEQLRVEIGRHEEAGLAAMDELEKTEPLLGERAEALRVVSERLAAAEKERRNTVNSLQTKLAELDPEREARAAHIPGELLRKYEQIRSRRGGVGVAPLGRDGLCGQCLVKVPVMLAKAAQEGLLETCESCGRLLVYVEDGE